MSVFLVVLLLFILEFELHNRAVIIATPIAANPTISHTRDYKQRDEIYGGVSCCCSGCHQAYLSEHLTYFKLLL